MFNLKTLMKCCCDHNAQNEEEKKPEMPKNLFPESRKTKLSNLLYKIRKEPKLVEELILAAPSPLTSNEPSSHPKLSLRIVESSAVPVGKVLSITSTGLENSRRGKQDFKTYIGSVWEEKGEIINDFAIEESSQGMGKQHLLIKFVPGSNKYTITDLGDGTGTFVKIDLELLLKEGFIISFGNSHLKVVSMENGKLVLKFLEGPKIHQEFIFDTQDEMIAIGRMADCRIRFDDTNLSRYQCHITYQEGRGWVLKDGINNKPSTNGTWIYVEEEFDICDKMLFKAGKTLFEASIEECNSKV